MRGHTTIYTVESYRDTCQTAADVAAAAALVRQRRKAVFFADLPRPATVAPQPIKAPEPEVVPKTPDYLGIFAMMTALGEVAKNQIAVSLTCDEIIRTVCSAMHVRKHEMLSLRRGERIMIPRHIAIALCKALTRRSLPQIGYAFGNRDHTSILYAVQKLAPVIAEIEDALDVAPLPYVVAITAAAYDRIKPSAPVRR
jgi:hypothetical protein